MSLIYRAGFLGVWDALYFTVLALGFTWIMAGNPPKNNPEPQLPQIRTVFRFTAAAVLGAVMIITMVLTAVRSGNFLNFLSSQSEGIISAFIRPAAGGADVTRQSLMENSFTPENIKQTISSVALRGGALVSVFFIFFLSRQTAIVLARLFKRGRANEGGNLTDFYVPRNILWLFSVSLPVVLICRVVSVKILEIAAWNLLVICVIMYLAQGAGIVLFALSRRPIPGMLKLAFGGLLIFAVFSPVINVFVLGALILLGIAENWLPLREMRNERVRNEK